MPFILYDVVPTPAGKQYTSIGGVKIAGNRGPLASIHRLKNTARETPFRWHAPAVEIVGAIGGKPTQELLVDLKPNVPKNVSLYRLLDIWGFSYPEWTPSALRLDALFSDQDEENPDQFKASFLKEHTEPDVLAEFFYVQGGTAGGTWNWGQVGSVNGALLWPDAFDYLCGEPRKVL